METEETEIKRAVEESIAEQTTSVLVHLTVEQKAALESKYNALPEEVRSSFNSKYPQCTIVERYIVRQMSKEANGKLASNLRPGWYQTLVNHAAGLLSGNEEIRKYSESALVNLADQLDAKESTTLVKKYKNQKDMTTKDAHIIQLAGIFGISAANLA